MSYLAIHRLEAALNHYLDNGTIAGYDVRLGESEPYAE